MHGYPVHEPLKRGGFTLLELVIGIALAGVVGLVTSGLFKAGIKSYNYSYRQTRIISSARKSLAGDGSRSGMILAAQGAVSVDSLSSSRLPVTPAGDFSTAFFVSGDNLYRSRLERDTLQADMVSGIAVSYYSMDDTGHIMVATAPASASFVISQIIMKGKLSYDKKYTFVSGTRLHNNP